MFCGRKVAPGSSYCSCVRTDTLADTILQCCADCSNDWGFAVICMQPTVYIIIPVTGTFVQGLTFHKGLGMNQMHIAEKAEDLRMKTSSKHFQ